MIFKSWNFVTRSESFKKFLEKWYILKKEQFHNVRIIIIILGGILKIIICLLYYWDFLLLLANFPVFLHQSSIINRIWYNRQILLIKVSKLLYWSAWHDMIIWKLSHCIHGDQKNNRKNNSTTVDKIIQGASNQSYIKQTP